MDLPFPKSDPRNAFFPDAPGAFNGLDPTPPLDTPGIGGWGSQNQVGPKSIELEPVGTIKQLKVSLWTSQSFGCAFMMAGFLLQKATEKSFSSQPGSFHVTFSLGLLSRGVGLTRTSRQALSADLPLAAGPPLPAVQLPPQASALGQNQRISLFFDLFFCCGICSFWISFWAVGGQLCIAQLAPAGMGKALWDTAVVNMSVVVKIVLGSHCGLGAPPILEPIVGIRGYDLAF